MLQHKKNSKVMCSMLQLTFISVSNFSFVLLPKGILYLQFVFFHWSVWGCVGPSIFFFFYFYRIQFFLVLYLSPGLYVTHVCEDLTDDVTLADEDMYLLNTNWYCQSEALWQCKWQLPILQSIQDINKRIWFQSNIEQYILYRNNRS